MINTAIKGLLCMSLCMASTTIVYAGRLAEDHVGLELNQLSRDSDYAGVYVYNNNGTVNSSPDDTPVGSTSRFDDDADPGYRLFAGKRLSSRWSIQLGIINAEMDSQVTDSNSDGRLEIFRLPVTNEFDAAHTVTANYKSKWSGQEVSAVFAMSESVDFLLGVGLLSLDESFQVISDDTVQAGIGTYTINTTNDMQGMHVGVAMDFMATKRFGLYLQGKLGWYDNDTAQSQQFVDTAFSRSNSGSSSEDSTVYDIQLGVNYLITEQLLLNLGYQVIDISNVALAENHFDTTIAGSDVVNDKNSLRWEGFNLGVSYRF